MREQFGGSIVFLYCSKRSLSIMLQLEALLDVSSFEDILE